MTIARREVTDQDANRPAGHDGGRRHRRLRSVARPLHGRLHADPGDPGLGRDRRDHRPVRAPRASSSATTRAPQPGAARLLPPGPGRGRRPGHLGRHLRLQRQQRRRRGRSATSCASRGTAGEFQGQTQISTTPATIAVCGTGTVAPTDVTLPRRERRPSSSATRACSSRLPQTLTVTEHFQLGRFGQVVLSSGGRLQQPTNVVAPGAAGARAPGGEQPQPDHRRRRVAGPEPRPDRVRPRRRAALRVATRCAAATRSPASSAS